MRRLFVLLALCVVSFVGCEMDDKGKIDFANHFNRHAFFVKHHEAGRCFVFHRHPNQYGLPFSEVECTPAVEALLINKKPCESKCQKNTEKLQPEKMEQK